MERSRSEHHPLSLALVYLNNGEKAEGEVAELENVFSGRLKSVAVDARIERFGELTYGIFYHGAKTGIAAWASRIQDGFPKDDAQLPGGVSVGGRGHARTSPERRRTSIRRNGGAAGSF